MWKKPVLITSYKEGHYVEHYQYTYTPLHSPHNKDTLTSWCLARPSSLNISHIHLEHGMTTPSHTPLLLLQMTSLMTPKTETHQYTITHRKVY